MLKLKPRIAVIQIAIAMLGIHWASALGADEVDELLGEMRASFLNELRVSASQVNQKYIETLRDVERQAVAARDYETALAAWKRAAEIENPTGIGPGSFTLTPMAAEAKGGVKKDPELGTLDYRSARGATASWSVPSMTPGVYEIQIEYSCGEPNIPPPWEPELLADGMSAGGELRAEVQNLSTQFGNRLDAKIESTGGWDQFKTISLGEVEVLGTSSTLHLSAVEVNPLGMMKLRNVHFIMKSLSVDTASSARLNRIRKSHRQRLAFLRDPIVDSYIERMDNLLATAPGDERDELWKLVQSEKRLAFATLRDKPPSAEEMSAAEGVAGALQSFEAIKGVRFVDHAENRGDCFMVQHGSDQFRVRLYLARCPDLPPGDRASARYFEINPVQAGRIGTEASLFTANYLKDRTLTLMPTGQEDRDGSRVMIVVIDGIGLFSRILVSRGLAMINTAPAEALPVVGIPSALYIDEILMPAQQRARESGRGAWSIASDNNRPTTNEGE